jgi:hypothetical protein
LFEQFRRPALLLLLLLPLADDTLQPDGAFLITFVYCTIA